MDRMMFLPQAGFGGWLKLSQVEFGVELQLPQAGFDGWLQLHQFVVLGGGPQLPQIGFGEWPQLLNAVVG